MNRPYMLYISQTNIVKPCENKLQVTFCEKDFLVHKAT